MTHACRCGHQWTATTPIIWQYTDGTTTIEDDCPKCGRWTLTETGRQLNP